MTDKLANCPFCGNDDSDDNACERNPRDRWCWGMRFHGEAATGLYQADNFEAAKATAQRDYESRIRSASASLPTAGNAELIRQLVEALKLGREWVVHFPDWIGVGKAQGEALSIVDTALARAEAEGFAP